MHKRALQWVFGFMLPTLQPIWDWGGLTTPPDNLWTIATLIDACYRFITFHVWVWWKEPRTGPRLGWFPAIMLLGNIALAACVLRQLARRRPADSMGTLLSARNG